MDFTKNRKKNENETTDLPRESSRQESYIGKSVTIKGNISADGPVVMDGKITGNIKSSGTVTIGTTGNSSGTLEAEHVEVYGKARGSIITQKKMTIHHTARFDGNITSANVVIEEGGLFNGNMNMKERK